MINIPINIFLIKTTLLSLCLIFITSCNADSKKDVKAMVSEKAAETIMQPGGYSNINNAKLQELLDKNVLLIDIRRKEEWQRTGIIKGSNTITFFDKTGRINNDFLPQFTAISTPDQAVILICRTGNRTKAASEAIAKQLGYKNVMNVTNGIMGWISEKRPIVKY